MAAKMEESTDVTKCYENYVLIDTGSYLAHKKYSRDLDSVLNRAKDAGVIKQIVVSMNVNGSKESLRLTRLYPDDLYATVGVHPHEAKQWGPSSYNDLKVLVANPEVVAIGECGLDYNRDFSPQALQREAFEAQVLLACEVKKPLYLHERDAFEDMMNILSRHKDKLPGGVVHCFTGNVDHAKMYVEMGFHIGLNGYVCKDRSESSVRALLQENVLPISKLLIESSAPYMFPNIQGAKLPAAVRDILTERSRGYLDKYCTFQRNEPCSLPILVELIAGLMGKTVEDVALASAFNSLRLFGLS